MGFVRSFIAFAVTAGFCADAQSLITVVRNKGDLTEFTANVLDKSPVVTAALSGANSKTLFAPSNDAWNALPKGLRGAFTWQPQLLERIAYSHLVSGVTLSVSKLTVGGLNQRFLLRTDSGNTLSAGLQEVRKDNGTERTLRQYVRKYGDNAWTQWSNVGGGANQPVLARSSLPAAAQQAASSNWVPEEEAVLMIGDLLASDGVVHVVNQVLVPSSMSGLTKSLRATAPVVYAAASVTALQVELDDHTAGPYTLFAPTDQAFKDVGVEEWSFGNHDALFQNTTTLRKLLRYHVLVGYHTYDSLNSGTFTTTEGSTVSFANGKLTDSHGTVATIVSTNTTGSNGIMHLIDAVLRPPNVFFQDQGISAPREVSQELSDLDLMLVSALAFFLVTLGAWFLYTGSVRSYLQRRARDTEANMFRIQKELVRLNAEDPPEERGEEYFLSLAERENRRLSGKDSAGSNQPNFHEQTMPQHVPVASTTPEPQDNFKRTPQHGPSVPRREVPDVLHQSGLSELAVVPLGAREGLPEDQASCSSFSSPSIAKLEHRQQQVGLAATHPDFASAAARIRAVAPPPPKPGSPDAWRRNSLGQQVPTSPQSPVSNYAPIAAVTPNPTTGHIRVPGGGVWGGSSRTSRGRVQTMGLDSGARPFYPSPMSPPYGGRGGARIRNMSGGGVTSNLGPHVGRGSRGGPEVIGSATVC
eukprot:Hpha_TRINITY_DN33791_c0_g1::TRINITY_DN33791_c0_g1_i1::g.24958::m.24958